MADNFAFVDCSELAVTFRGPSADQLAGELSEKLTTRSDLAHAKIVFDRLSTDSARVTVEATEGDIALEVAIELFADVVDEFIPGSIGAALMSEDMRTEFPVLSEAERNRARAARILDLQNRIRKGDA